MEALPPQIFLTLKCLVWAKLQNDDVLLNPLIHDTTRCTTGCTAGCTTGCIVYTQLYNDQTSTKRERTAAVFRHIFAWILHVCLIGLERFLQNIAHESVVTNFRSLYRRLNIPAPGRQWRREGLNFNLSSCVVQLCSLTIFVQCTCPSSLHAFWHVKAS